MGSVRRAATQQGIVFHLLGATSQFGKIGALAIGDSHEKAAELFQRTAEALSAIPK